MDRVVIEGGGSGADMIAWVSIFIAICALIWTAYWNRRSEKRGYLDEFWFRQIVAPKCVTPVLELYDKWQLKVDHLGDDAINAGVMRDWIASFQDEKARVVSSAWIARVFSSGFYALCGSKLDDVEDEFVAQFGGLLLAGANPAQAKAAMKAALADASVEILSEAARIHGGNLKLRQSGRNGVFARKFLSTNA